MLHRMMTLTAALLGAALLVPAEAVAQDKTGATWPSPVATRGPVAEKDKKPAPRRTINGMWSALRLGNQSGGVQLKPNNGKPENELPYTPYGLQVYRSHKPLEGIGLGRPRGQQRSEDEVRAARISPLQPLRPRHPGLPGRTEDRDALQLRQPLADDLDRWAAAAQGGGWGRRN
jgi:hypothetical protein